MTERTATAGLVFDDRYLQHNPGLYPVWSTGEPYPFVDPVLHLSNHRLVMRTKHLIDLSGLGEELQRIPAYAATEEDLTRYHAPEYVARVRAISAAGGGETGEGASAGPGSYEIALLAAGGAMAAVDAVVAGLVRRVFVNVRPPGHHAVRDRGMGYCLFNNVVVAARHAQRRHGLERVLIVDWDVHHGNGTQDAFFADPSVLFISLHQDGLYPEESGGRDEVGEGAGTGFTVNIPLPAGCGDAAYLAAFERVVVPAAEAFRPELVLVSAGQDASAMDQHRRMCVTTEGYRRMTTAMMEVADAYAGGAAGGGAGRGVQRDLRAVLHIGDRGDAGGAADGGGGAAGCGAAGGDAAGDDGGAGRGGGDRGGRGAIATLERAVAVRSIIRSAARDTSTCTKERQQGYWRVVTVVARGTLRRSPARDHGRR